MSDELVKKLKSKTNTSPYQGKRFESLVNPDGPEAAARIRLLEQQLKTAREALEPFANEAPRYDGDNDEDTAWETLPTVGELRRAAAAIRSLGEKATSPDSASDSAG